MIVQKYKRTRLEDYDKQHKIVIYNMQSYILGNNIYDCFFHIRLYNCFTSPADKACMLTPVFSFVFMAAG